MNNKNNILKQEFDKKILEIYELDDINNSKNDFFWINIFTNKPVYKMHEQIKIYLFLYNKLTKNPIINNFIKEFNIEMIDLSDNVIHSKLIYYNSNNENVYNFENDLNSGFYKINVKYDDILIDSLKFLVQSNSEKNMTISINWNKEYISKNDKIIGDILVNLKSFNEKNNEFYSYNIFDDMGNLLFSEKNIDLKKYPKINFITPNKYFTSIVVKIDFNIDGINQSYTKTFNLYNNTFDINYFCESINPKINKENKFYLKITQNNNNDNIPINSDFEIWEDEKLIYKSQTIIDGRGNFFVNNYCTNKKYCIRVKNYKKEITFTNFDWLKTNKKVYKFGDILKFDFLISDKSMKINELFIGIHDNSKFIISKKLWYFMKNIKIDDGFQKGGIYEIVWFDKKFNVILKNIFFVKPKNNLNIDFKYNINKNLINFDVLINNNEFKDDIYLYLRVYEDNLLNYIDENKRQQNLITKVFLTNESEDDNIDFNYSKFYDFFNDNNDNNLDLYIGTLFKRLNNKKLLFYERRIREKFYHSMYEDGYSNCDFDSFEEVHHINFIGGIINSYDELDSLGDHDDNTTNYNNIPNMKSTNNLNKNSNHNKPKNKNLNNIPIIENEIRISYQKGFFKINNDNFKDNLKLLNENLLYRVEITAISKNGIYGYNTFNISVKNDIDVLIDYPSFIYLNNDFEININIKNNLNHPINVKIYNQHELYYIENNSSKQIKTVLNINNYNLLNTKIKKEITLNYSYDKINKIHKEIIYPYLIAREIEINKNYLSNLDNFNNLIEINNFISFKKILNNNISINISLKNNRSDLILGIVKNLIKDPYGCFEQMCSVTFPMAIAYELLLNVDENDMTKDLKKEIFDKLKKNLNGLLNYETKTGGFDLFGSSPGSTAMTAYGLLQFKTLNKIGFNLEDLIQRNIKWLFTLYKNGNFKQKYSYFSDYSESPINTANAYIFWVISEIYPNKLKEIKLNLNELENEDSYILILIGLIYYNIGDIKNYERICIIIEGKFNKDYITGSINTVIRSLESSKIIETNALFILLELKKINEKKIKFVGNAIEYLYKQYSNGYFKSTQGTIMSLLAINEYLSINNLCINNCVFELNINGVLKEICLNNTHNMKDLNLFNNNWNYLENQNFRIQIYSKNNNKNNNNKYNTLIETNITYYKNISIDKLNSKKNNYFNLNIIKLKEEDNIVFFEINYENLKNEELGMSNIELKISNNYEINHNDLLNLKEIGIIDYYEISKFNDKIIFYFRSIKKRVNSSIKLNFIKKFNNLEFNQIPGQNDISCMYLFYGKDESIVYSEVINQSEYLKEEFTNLKI